MSAELHPSVHRLEESGRPAAAAAEAFDAARRYAQGIVELAAAEARLAAISGASMLLMMMVAAVLVTVAWGLLAGVAAYLLVAGGLSWPVAGLLLAAAHAAAAYLLWRGAVSLSRSLTLPALRRTVLSTEE